MMDREWQAILNHYGQQVLVYNRGQENTVPIRAILQPMPPGKGEQRLPTELGLERRDRMLYLGPSGVGLTPRCTLVEWAGEVFEVEQARPVLTDKLHHWWAVLCPTLEAPR